MTAKLISNSHFTNMFVLLSLLHLLSALTQKKKKKHFLTVIFLFFLFFCVFLIHSRVQDRFYLSAIDKKWHSGCLQCFVCENTLDGQTSLFCREGTIYCKDDYYRWVEWFFYFLYFSFNSTAIFLCICKVKTNSLFKKRVIITCMLLIKKLTAWRLTMH